VRTKRKVNIASMWVIVIFTMIACTLVALFMLVYHSILQEELHDTLRDQVAVLADHADVQIVDTMDAQAVQRIASKDASTSYISTIAASEYPDATDIRGLITHLAEVNALLDQADRIEMYFPKSGMIAGTQGVYFLNDKKYTTQETPYDFLLEIDAGDSVWMRRLVLFNNTETLYISFVRPYPGVYDSGEEPQLVLSIKEETFHTLLRKSLRTLDEKDLIFLTDKNGKIWTASDSALINTVLPTVESSFQPCTLQNGSRVIYVEAASVSGQWSYVLTHPTSGRFTGYDSIFSLWAIVCLVLLVVGLILVLSVMMKHYLRPMNRLIDHFSIPVPENEGKHLSSPGDRFIRIETALSDLNKMRQDQENFLSQNQPLLRESWLNCFIRGEAHYQGPQPQLDIFFPYPYYQAVITAPAVSEEEQKCILSHFSLDGWKVYAFESREKESVFLFNHGFEADALPQRLEMLSQQLSSMNSALVFGVGILAQTEALTPASFRCARRALAARYFEKNQRVSVFDPDAPHAEYESAMTQVISQLNELTGLIRHQSAEEVNQAIDSIVTQLKESAPYPNVMRSIMLLAAMFLSKVVYDMKGSPESVYGENLTDAYYHIEGISEFSQRLKQDSARLSQFLTRETSASNRSVVQYAIHHIRNAPPSNLSIQSIADALSISTGHLSRMFHLETGRKLVDYLQEVRMEHAARLLAEGEMSNEEICEHIGYSRLQYFSSKFKEHYGLTLNEYRRKVQYEKNSQE